MTILKRFGHLPSPPTVKVTGLPAPDEGLVSLLGAELLPCIPLIIAIKQTTHLHNIKPSTMQSYYGVSKAQYLNTCVNIHKCAVL